MFLTAQVEGIAFYAVSVAIPSNRVNVSYVAKVKESLEGAESRNPLKSGQCFLQGTAPPLGKARPSRNPLKSGQCFLRRGNHKMDT